MMMFIPSQAKKTMTSMTGGGVGTKMANETDLCSKVLQWRYSALDKGDWWNCPLCPTALRIIFPNTALLKTPHSESHKNSPCQPVSSQEVCTMFPSLRASLRVSINLFFFGRPNEGLLVKNSQ